MNLLKGLFDSVYQLLVKFISFVPSGSDIDITDEALTLKNIMGYVNWFVPFKELALIFNVGTIMIAGVAIGMVLLKWARQGFFKI